jgi:hypothetical protein
VVTPRQLEHDAMGIFQECPAQLSRQKLLVWAWLGSLPTPVECFVGVFFCWRIQLFISSNSLRILFRHQSPVPRRTSRRGCLARCVGRRCTPRTTRHPSKLVRGTLRGRGHYRCSRAGRHAQGNLATRRHARFSCDLLPETTPAISLSFSLHRKIPMRTWGASCGWRFARGGSGTATISPSARRWAAWRTTRRLATKLFH